MTKTNYNVKRWNISSRHIKHGLARQGIEARSFTLTLRGSIAADLARVCTGNQIPTDELRALGEALRSATDSHAGHKYYNNGNGRCVYCDASEVASVHILR